MFKELFFSLEYNWDYIYDWMLVKNEEDNVLFFVLLKKLFYFIERSILNQ